MLSNVQLRERTRPVETKAGALFIVWDPEIGLFHGTEVGNTSDGATRVLCATKRQERMSAAIRVRSQHNRCPDAPRGRQLAGQGAGVNREYAALTVIVGPPVPFQVRSGGQVWVWEGRGEAARGPLRGIAPERGRPLAHSRGNRSGSGAVSRRARAGRGSGRGGCRAARVCRRSLPSPPPRPGSAAAPAHPPPVEGA